MLLSNTVLKLDNFTPFSVIDDGTVAGKMPLTNFDDLLQVILIRETLFQINYLRL